MHCWNICAFSTLLSLASVELRKNANQLNSQMRVKPKRGRTAEPDALLRAQPTLCRRVGLHLLIPLLAEILGLRLEEVSLPLPFVRLRIGGEPSEIGARSVESVDLLLIRRDGNLQVERSHLPEGDKERRPIERGTFGSALAPFCARPNNGRRKYPSVDLCSSENTL